jgi:peptidoglycan/xylan/chitin deacetylase (PgdA/CDA1 family)
MYHLVSPRPPERFEKYTVTASEFARQMKWLRLARYRPVGIDRLLAHRNGRVSLPPRSVVITFDDGYLDCLRYAVPILEATRFRAVFYVVAGLLGKRSSWLVDERGVELPLVDAAAVRQLDASGFEIGSHSMTHPHLTRLPAQACRAELRDSRRALEDSLGHAVEHLAYPYGDCDDAVRKLAAESGYRGACGVHIALSGAGDHPLALPRVPVTGADSLVDFACRLARAGRPVDLLRGKLARLRRRTASRRTHR